MRPWVRAFVGVVVVALAAVAGILANFALLGLTQDAHDPVGQLSPRAALVRDARLPTIAPIPAEPTPGAGDEEEGESEGDD